MIVARCEVPGLGTKCLEIGINIAPSRREPEIGLRAKLRVPNFTPAPNQASLRDAALLRYAIQAINCPATIVKSLRDKKPTQLFRSLANLALMG
jgi:hypothetical protein